MATPITWQNINAPSFGEANRLMGLSQQSILGAFDTAKTVLADSQAFDKELWKRQDQEATQDVLGKIYQAQNVDQFKTLNQSGALDQAVAANGAVIDRAAVNALRDGRVGKLQQWEKQAGEFSDWTTTREQRPIVNGIMTDIYRGNTELAAKTLADNPHLLNAPDIQKALTEHKRALVVQGREDTRFEWDKVAQQWKVADAKHKADLRPYEVQLAQLAPQAKQAEIRASNASADASVARAAADRDAATLRAQEAVDKRLTETLLKRNELASKLGGLNTEAAQKYVADAINAATKDEETRTRLNSAFTAIKTNPEFASAAPAEVVNALLGDISTGSGLRKFIWNGTGDGAESALRGILKNSVRKDDNDLRKDVSRLDEQIDFMRRTLGYSGDSPAPAPAPGPSPTPAPATAPEPSKPAPTREAPPSVFNAAQAAELVRQRTELEKGVRKAFSPEIQTLLEKDKAQGQAFQATVAKRKADEEAALSKKREELSKSLGIEVVAKPAPWTPSNAGWAPATSPRFGPQTNTLQAFTEQQKRYENWVEAMDARLGAEAKKSEVTPQPPASGSPEVVTSSKVAPASPAPVKPIVQNPDGALVTPAGKAVRPNATLAIDGNTGSPVGVTRNLEVPKELSKGKPITLVQADPKNLKAGDSFKATVTWVKDGDTADLSNGVICRINGIDAPEAAKPRNRQPAQAFSGEATRALEDMVKNKEVTVRIVEPPTGSNYGRASCILEIEGKDVNLTMVQKGLAWSWGAYIQDSFRRQRYEAAQAKAKQDKKGLWVDPNAIFPNTYQRQYR